MDPAMEKERKVQKRSASVQKAPSHSKGSVYHTETTPTVRGESSKPRSGSSTSILVLHLNWFGLSPVSNPPSFGTNTPTSSGQSDRPQHPSLSRVKGRSNMYTPPRNGAERSWLNDQSPVRGGVQTPPQQSSSMISEYLKEYGRNLTTV